MQELVLILILCIPVAFSAYAVRRYRRPASDRFYHQLLVQLIRENGGRPITTHRNLVNTHTQSYPQLLHVVLAWMPQRWEDWFSRNMPVLVNVLLGAAVFFIVQLPSQFMKNTSWGFEQRLLAELCFVLTPYLYNTSNAKNVGLSARGIGLLLGSVYLAAVLVFVAQGSWIVFAAAAVLAFLILFSSQFATQFLIFASTLLAVLFQNGWVFVLPLTGYSIYLICFPRMAIATVKGQLGHKVLYVRHLAERFILKHRPSIWRDLWNDIPRLILHLFRTSPNTATALKNIFTNRYIFTNAIVLVILEMPLLVPALVFVFWKQEFHSIWALTVIAATVIFFCTTFRFTRFLGEPERYLEFVFPFLAILAVLVLPRIALYVLLAYMFVRLIYALMRLAPDTNATTTTYQQELQKMDQTIRDLQATGKEVRLLSNSTEATKLFLRPDLSIFYYWVTSTKNDEFAFTDLHTTTYDFIDARMLTKLAQRYKLNYVLIDCEGVPEMNETLFSSDVQAQSLISTGRFTLYSLQV